MPRPSGSWDGPAVSRLARRFRGRLRVNTARYEPAGHPGEDNPPPVTLVRSGPSWLGRANGLELRPQRSPGDRAEVIEDVHQHAEALQRVQRVRCTFRVDALVELETDERRADSTGQTGAVGDLG